MKKLLYCFCVLLTIALSFSASTGFVFADGMIAPPPDYWIHESQQKAVIFHNGQTETLIIQISFQGDAQDFAWIVPVPSYPDVDQSTDELFIALDDLTKPQYRVQKQTGYSILNAPMAERADSVTVLETKKVDIYDVAILEAKDASDLAQWFKDNGYRYPVSQSYILKEYIDHNWYFVAAKISTQKLGALVQGQLRSGHATPLKIVFKTDKIAYPLKISSITADQYQSDILKTYDFNYSTQGWQVYQGHVKLDLSSTDAYEGRASLAINGQGNFKVGTIVSGFIKDRTYTASCYIHKLNTSRIPTISVEGSGVVAEQYSADLKEKQGEWIRQAVTFTATAKQHRLVLTGQNINKSNTGLLDAVQVEVGDKPGPFEPHESPIIKRPIRSSEQNQDQSATSQSTPNSGLREPNIYPGAPRRILPYPANQPVGILLYIFTQNKQDIPLFRTQYAGRVSKKTIENLASNSQGEPALTARKSMYLTRLYRSMSQTDMTYDLYPKPAENNRPQGSGKVLAVEPTTLVLVLGLPLLLELVIIIWLFARKRN